MKDIDLKEQDIKKLIGTDQCPIYFPFDDNEERKVVHSKEISKNQLAFLYSNLYSAYLKLYFENKTLEEELKDALKKEEVSTTDESYDTKFEKYFNELIDKRIKEKLTFDVDNEAYCGRYAALNYGDDNLGYVCLKADYDD